MTLQKSIRFDKIWVEIYNQINARAEKVGYRVEHPKNIRISHEFYYGVHTNIIENLEKSLGLS